MANESTYGREADKDLDGLFTASDVGAIQQLEARQAAQAREQQRIAGMNEDMKLSQMTADQFTEYSLRQAGRQLGDYLKEAPKPQGDSPAVARARILRAAMDSLKDEPDMEKKLEGMVKMLSDQGLNEDAIKFTNALANLRRRKGEAAAKNPLFGMTEKLLAQGWAPDEVKRYIASYDKETGLFGDGILKTNLKDDKYTQLEPINNKGEMIYQQRNERTGKIERFKSDGTKISVSATATADQKGTDQGMNDIAKAQHLIDEMKPLRARAQSGQFALQGAQVALRPGATPQDVAAGWKQLRDGTSRMISGIDLNNEQSKAAFERSGISLGVIQELQNAVNTFIDGAPDKAIIAKMAQSVARLQAANNQVLKDVGNRQGQVARSLGAGQSLVEYITNYGQPNEGRVDAKGQQLVKSTTTDTTVPTKASPQGYADLKDDRRRANAQAANTPVPPKPGASAPVFRKKVNPDGSIEYVKE